MTVQAPHLARLLTRRATRLAVKASGEHANNAKWLYLLSDPIPEVYGRDGVVPTEVHSVRFSLRSCDQGWSSTSEGQNTYLESWTWFEAAIIRPEQPFRRPPEWLIDATREPMKMNYLADEEWTELSSPYRQKNERWLVQKNVHASDRIRNHEVEWSREAGEDESREFDKETGSGRGLGFTRALQAGDRIALIARARFSGWVNNVYSAEIEVVYQS